MTQQQAAEQLFAGSSEMAMLMRSHDWSQTPLGAVEQWSQSLKTSVRIMLTSRQPMFVWWGDELINLYNDAYKAIVGGKHPQALGQPASVVWQEIWDQVSPRAASAMLKNEGTYDEALLLIMERNSYPEETYYTFSYSPVPDDQGGTGGILCANTDDTQRIIGERQLALLQELAAKTADARTFHQACTLSASCLGTNPYDLPFAMLYLLESDQQRLVLAGTSGIDHTHPAVPAVVDLTANTIWSFADVIKTHQSCLLSDLAATFGSLPTGAWSQPPHQAVVVPLASSGQTGQAGVLVAGLNPFRLFDSSYRGFVDLVTAQIAASIANAQAYEEERKRAEALAELDRAKTAFFNNVSHEFRTPLTLMLSPLEELSQTLDERLQPDEREQLQLVQRNGLRLQKLVNTLLDFSRTEADRVQAIYEPIDLASFTTELTSLFRSLIERAGMTLQVDCRTLPEPVYVDREMWEKIVLNLLSNAFKFTFTGGITVRLQQVDDAVELSIEDTGVGIPAAELPQLFKRFHRVSDTRSRTYEGTGIGLALVQDLVKLHGGTIRVTSQVDRGTRFTINLPLGSAHLPHDRLGVRTYTPTALRADSYIEEASRWLPAVGNGEWGMGNVEELSTPTPYSSLPTSVRILLVDDNADMRGYVQRLLSVYWEVETANDGLAALEAIAQQPPGLVLSDVMMPRLDGFGLLRALRADERTKEIPLILLSARAGEESRIEGLAAGADDYLTKPFSARELLARVESCLKLAQLRRAATQQEQVLRLEAELAKQHAETILSSINDAFYVLDRDWRFTYVNNRLCEMVSMERDQVLGYCFWDLFPDTVNTDIYVQFQQAFHEQTPSHAEYFYAAWNRWYDHRVYPSSDGLTVLGTDITARKQAEADLRKSAQQLRAIYDGTDAYVVLLSPDGTLLEANRASLEFGISQHDDVLGLPFWQTEWFRYTPKAPERVRQAVIQAAGGEFIRYEAPIINPSGELSTFDLSFYPITNEEGDVILILTEGRNITDRKQAEAELRESEARFRQMADSAPVLIWMSGTDTLCYYFNQPWLNFTGRMIEQERGNGWADGVHPDDFQHCLAVYVTSFEARQPFQIEYRLKRFDGVYRCIVNSAAPRFTAEGDFLGYIGSCIDIEDRKQVETALYQSEERFRLSTYAVDGVVYDWDLETHQVYRSEGLYRLIGIHPEDVPAAREWWAERIHPEDLAHIHAVITPVFESDSDRYEFEYRVRHRDGHWLNVWDRGYLIRNQQGQVKRVVGSTTDITSRKQAEQEREHLLNRERLAREEAEAANRIKDEFLAVLSHELRSPLNPILGWSKMLRAGNLDTTQTERALETIERNAKLQTQLIEDLLDVSRILQGKLNLNMVPVDLVSSIEAALETVRLAAEAKSIQVQTMLDPSAAHVLGDAARLQQVIWNLLSNAVKFTPEEGQIEVRLSLVTVPQANNSGRQTTYAQVQVADTGKGIAPDFLPYVFEYFRQEDGRTTRKFGGLGLGLAIVRHLVELHGGTVQVASPGEGQGATFTVRLPLLKESGARQQAQEDALPTLAASAQPLQAVNVLLVDDDDDSRNLITFTLKQSGAIVTPVTSAAEALDVLKQTRFDLLISDIGMPEMDGYTLMQQIRAMPPEQGGNMLAIALTAYAGEYNQRRAIAVGFQKHISKPVEPDALISIVGATCASNLNGTATNYKRSNLLL
ncbi:PAS domain S-box protein [Leptolyngbya sp. FACHB-321]|uniref:ATP-binding protein n=1 Tax=Leptolyngbya sp. FACHB-321 TaxID=2692807 RepID=UPI001689ADC4|nr:ATP-binding protein [Leptolyngbya sp. FACHB-321]MBD2034630.1 PAS domain S-box protein [Leptolyngbya sp. FACHB-321]